MKSLVEYLNNPLVESKKEIALCWSHDEPDMMYIVDNVSFEELKDKLEDYAWSFDMYSSDDNNLCVIKWNDEVVNCFNTGYRNLQQIKKSLQNLFQKAIDSKDEPDTLLIEDDPILGGYYEYHDEDANLSAKEYVDSIFSDMQDSYVDGDSGYACSIIDINKKKVVVGNESVFFCNYIEFLEMLGE